MPSIPKSFSVPAPLPSAWDFLHFLRVLGKGRPPPDVEAISPEAFGIR